MPGTHLLPPNLLKLFAPRPPLPYTRPLDRDIDRVRPKNVEGVGHILAQLREARTQDLIDSGNAAKREEDAMEEGEEPTFTYAEETKRQIRREERKQKKAEDFAKAKDSCTRLFLIRSLLAHTDYMHRQARRRPGGYWRPLQDTLHLSFSMLFVCLASATSDLPPQHKNASESDLRREFESFGSIERVRIVRDKNGRSRGYAFIVFERERDMKGTTFPSLFCAHSPSILLRACVAGVILCCFQLRTRNQTGSISWASASSSTSSAVAQ